MPVAGQRIDPEWRLYARSSSDDKAPIMAMLAALDALKAGQTATDTLNVSSRDGTTKTIVVTITGANDAPLIHTRRGQGYVLGAVS